MGNNPAAGSDEWDLNQWLKINYILFFFLFSICLKHDLNQWFKQCDLNQWLK